MGTWFPSLFIWGTPEVNVSPQTGPSQEWRSRPSPSAPQMDLGGNSHALRSRMDSLVPRMVIYVPQCLCFLSMFFLIWAPMVGSHLCYSLDLVRNQDWCEKERQWEMREHYSYFHTRVKAATQGSLHPVHPQAAGYPDKECLKRSLSMDKNPPDWQANICLGLVTGCVRSGSCCSFPGMIQKNSELAFPPSPWRKGSC